MRAFLCASLALAVALALAVTLHPLGAATGIGVYPAPQGTPWTYQLLSGFVPALTVVGLASIFSGMWHHVNCHRERCWRIGRHKIGGTPWCNVHHGEARPQASAEELLTQILAEIRQLR